MGESKQKRRSHATVLDSCPHCIYCAGEQPATTVDHVPPIIMFAQRRRPKGLEFGSCEPCNVGTKHADLVAAMIGRSMPDSGTEAGRAEMKSIFSAVNNNIPGLLQEMHLPGEQQSAAGWREESGGLLRAKPHPITDPSSLADGTNVPHFNALEQRVGSCTRAPPAILLGGVGDGHPP